MKEDGGDIMHAVQAYVRPLEKVHLLGTGDEPRLGGACSTLTRTETGHSPPTCLEPYINLSVSWSHKTAGWPITSSSRFTSSSHCSRADLVALFFLYSHTDYLSNLYSSPVEYHALVVPSYDLLRLETQTCTTSRIKLKREDVSCSTQ